MLKSMYLKCNVIKVPVGVIVRFPNKLPIITFQSRAKSLCTLTKIWDKYNVIGKTLF